MRVDERKGLKTTSNTDCLFDADPVCPSSCRASKDLTRQTSPQECFLRDVRLTPKCNCVHLATSHVIWHVSLQQNSKRPPSKKQKRRSFSVSFQFSMMKTLERPWKIFLNYTGYSFVFGDWNMSWRGNRPSCDLLVAWLLARQLQCHQTLTMWLDQFSKCLGRDGSLKFS